jgi:hypothetical protein
MLRWVWAEMDYRIDVYRVTKGGHTEHLWGMQNKLGDSLFISVCRMLPSFAIQVYKFFFCNTSGNYE